MITATKTNEIATVGCYHGTELCRSLGISNRRANVLNLLFTLQLLQRDQ